VVNDFLVGFIFGWLEKAVRRTASSAVMPTSPFGSSFAEKCLPLVVERCFNLCSQAVLPSYTCTL